MTMVGIQSYPDDYVGVFENDAGSWYVAIVQKRVITLVSTTTFDWQEEAEELAHSIGYGDGVFIREHTPDYPNNIVP